MQIITYLFQSTLSRLEANRQEVVAYSLGRSGGASFPGKGVLSQCLFWLPKYLNWPTEEGMPEECLILLGHWVGERLKKRMKSPTNA